MARKRQSKPASGLTITEGPIVNTGLFKSGSVKRSGDFASYMEDEQRRNSFAAVREKLAEIERIARHVTSLPPESLAEGELNDAHAVIREVVAIRSWLTLESIDEFRLSRLLLAVHSMTLLFFRCAMRPHEKHAIAGQTADYAGDRGRASRTAEKDVNVAAILKYYDSHMTDSRKQSSVISEISAMQSTPEGRRKLGISKILSRSTIESYIRRRNQAPKAE